jgi:antitoxin component YwqK of YwqJK toxin-antitoxin module
MYGENDEVVSIAHYCNGKLSGESIWFNRSGHITKKLMYLEGRLNGEVLEYFENKQIRGEILL